MITNDVVSMRPFVVFAIKVMAPGRRRVEMVKLAHDMNYARGDTKPDLKRFRIAVHRHPQAVPSNRRAA